MKIQPNTKNIPKIDDELDKAINKRYFAWDSLTPKEENKDKKEIKKKEENKGTSNFSNIIDLVKDANANLDANLESLTSIKRKYTYWKKRVWSPSIASPALLSIYDEFFETFVDPIIRGDHCLGTIMAFGEEPKCKRGRLTLFKPKQELYFYFSKKIVSKEEFEKYINTSKSSGLYTFLCGTPHLLNKDSIQTIIFQAVNKVISLRKELYIKVSC